MLRVKNTILHWSDSFTYNGLIYNYTMVGTDPKARLGDHRHSNHTDPNSFCLCRWQRVRR